MEKENNKEQYRAQLSAALDKLLELSSKESGWTIAFDKHNVLATARQTKGFLSSRGQGLIPAPPAVIFSIVFDVKRLPQWDGMIDKATVVQQFDSDLILLHILLKGTFPLSPRDLCVIFGYRLYEDGSYIVGFRSVLSTAVPEVRGYVRAHVDPSGFVIRPSHGKHCRSSEIEYILQIDPRGWMPFSVAKMLQNYEPLRIAKVRSICDSRIETDWDYDKVEAELCRREASEFVQSEKKRIESKSYVPVQVSNNIVNPVVPQPEESSQQGNGQSVPNIDPVNRKESTTVLNRPANYLPPSPIKKTKMQSDLLGLSLSPMPIRRTSGAVLKLPNLSEMDAESESSEPVAEEGDADAALNEKKIEFLELDEPKADDTVSEETQREDHPTPEGHHEMILSDTESLASNQLDLGIEQLVLKGQYRDALALLRNEIEKIDEESEASNQHVQDLEWSLMNEQQRHSQSLARLSRTPLDRSRIRMMLNDYAEQVKRLAERGERVEHQIKQREAYWETRLSAASDKLMEAERIYDINKQELRNKKYWKRVWNSVIIVLVFVMWPLLASGLINHFSPIAERWLSLYSQSARIYYTRYLTWKDAIISRIPFMSK